MLAMDKIESERGRRAWGGTEETCERKEGRQTENAQVIKCLHRPAHVFEKWQ